MEFKVLLYDVCDESSFNSVQNWIKIVNQNSNRTTENGQPNISLFLIGNKIEKEDRVVTREMAEEVAKSLGMKHFEISCKINMNLHETMASMLLDCYQRVSSSSENFQLNEEENKKGNKSGCCENKK